MLIALAVFWLYPSEEKVARAREQSAVRPDRVHVAMRAHPSAKPSEAKAPVRVVAEAARLDRAALLHAVVQHPATLQAAATPVPRAAPPRLGREYVANGIRSAIPLLTECYDALREKQPDAAGTVQISATIDAEPATGAVVAESEVSGKDELANDAEFTRCLRETMRTIELEPPDRAGRATFSFPLRFGALPSSDAGSR